MTACRVCRCTEADCRQCVRRTGKPCSWVGPHNWGPSALCSACKGIVTPLNGALTIAAGHPAEQIWTHPAFFNPDSREPFVRTVLSAERYAVIYPLLGSRAALHVGRFAMLADGGHDDVWEYPTELMAHIHLALSLYAEAGPWRGLGDPPGGGWDRHPKSGRRNAPAYFTRAVR